MKTFLIIVASVSMITVSPGKIKNNTNNNLVSKYSLLIDTLPKQNPDTMNKNWNDNEGKKIMKDTTRNDTTSKVPPKN